MDKLNDILSSREFLLGDEFTIADVAVASYLLYVPQFFRDVDLSRWPHLVRYMRTCASREYYSAAFTPGVAQYLISTLESMQGRDKSEKLFGMF